MFYREILTNTPVGAVMLTSYENYLVRLDFGVSESETYVKYLTKHFGKIEYADGHNEALAKAKTQLIEYFDGKRRVFELETRVLGTEFYLKCWKSLCEIPYGQTISYGELAVRVNSPKGFRAVGQANHHNPISIIIPCHRVLASGGQLGGYGGGLENKQILLDIECKNMR